MSGGVGACGSVRVWLVGMRVWLVSVGVSVGVSVRVWLVSVGV